VGILWNDDAIFEKLEERSKFPKSNDKRLVAWFLQHQAYFREKICKDDEDIIG